MSAPSLLRVVVPVCLLAACGPVDETAAFSDPDGGVVDSTACQRLGRARTDSEACCPEFGVDACGATLFCAAFDGRTVPTCYPEFSRLPGAGCTEDRQCASGRCKAQQGKCAYPVGFACDAALGCGSRDPLNPVALCAGSPSSSRLDPANLDCVARPALGGECGLCVTTGDCRNPSLTCASSRCVGISDAVVVSSACCLDGYWTSVSGGYRCN